MEGPLELLHLPPGVAADVAAVERYLRRADVVPYAWSNAPGDRYPPHEHSYTKLLMCAAGSITFELEGAAAIELLPGEGFVLLPGARHAAVVGPDGCTCLEGHR